MLIARRHGPVTVFRLARTLLGKGRYYTACAQVREDYLAASA